MDEATVLEPRGQTTVPHRYQSKEYMGTFFKMIHQLRVDEAFCDVHLAVEDKIFPCHKVVLMAGSSYFYAMFMNNMSEHDKNTVDIGGLSAHHFAAVLDFMYTGEIEVTEDNCEDLLVVADFLSVREVVTACCSFLKDQLQPDNCVGVYLFANSRAFDQLRRDAESYLSKNFLKVVQGEEYLAIDKDNLVHILHSENLHVENEFQVFTAAMDWLLHQPADRKQHIFDVMAPIRFPIIAESQIDKYIDTLKDVDISILVALRKIVADFRIDKKLFRMFDHGVHKSKINPILKVPRQCARKQIYICGGFTRPKGGRWSDARTLSSVQRYDTFHKMWHECAPLQYSRSALGAGVLNGQVCVVGGENDMLILDSMETYNPDLHSWKSLPGLTNPRCSQGVCTIDNCLYVAGGWVGSELGSTVEKYDPDMEAWAVIAHCRTLKCWMGVTADKGLMYLVGGCNDLSEELTSVESFNPFTKEWAALPDMKEKRSYTTAAVLDDCLYAVGGYNEQSGTLKTVEKLNFKLGYWVEVCPMLEPRAGACMVVVNNMLYVMGGRSCSNEFTAPASLNTMECYDPHTDTWTDAGTMITSRCEGAAVII